MAVTVTGLPLGISEWNRIKHRRLADISRKWRSKPSVSHQVVIQLIGATTTSSGVTVTCDIDHSLYPKGIRITDAGAAFVYVLLEHKSTVDARTPLQLLRYMLRLWIEEIERGDTIDGKLSPIIPLVFYHGRGRWTPPLSIQEMIRAPEGMKELLQRFGHYAVHELGRIAPSRLSRDRFVASSLFALAHDRLAPLTKAGEDLLVAGIVDTELGRYHVNYIAVWHDLSPERLSAALRRAGEDPQEMEALVGTIAETWLAEGEARGEAKGKAVGIAEGEARGEAKGKAVGIAEGEARGEARGKADAFLRVARRKFHIVPEDRVRQVRGASTETLDAWLEALITAEDIDAVFTDRNDH